MPTKYWRIGLAGENTDNWNKLTECQAQCAKTVAVAVARKNIKKLEKLIEFHSF
jgi:hypothetical protein